MATEALAPSETRRVTAHGRAINVEIYRPESDGPAPGILMLHEVFGVLDAYRKDCVDLAARGYVVWLPNLYTGGAARYCIRSFFTSDGLKNRSTSGLNREVHELLDALKADDACNGALGMIGMCLTGGFVLQMARRADMAAPVVYHHSLGIEGAGIPNDESLDDVTRMQGHWAEIDLWCPAARRAKLYEALGERLERYEYPIQHGFRSFRRDTPESKQAWERTIAFFDTHLQR